MDETKPEAPSVDLKALIDEASARLDKFVDAVNQQFNELQSKVATLGTDVSTATSSVSGLAVSLGTLSSRVYALESSATSGSSATVGEGDAHAGLVAQVEALGKRISYAFERLKHHGIEAVEPEPAEESAVSQAAGVGDGG